MESTNVNGILLLTHSVHKKIEKAEAYNSLSEADKGFMPNIEHIDVCPLSVSLEESSEIDWFEAAALQKKIYEEEIKPFLNEHPSYKIIYFGAAPIPLVLNLGYLIGDWHRTEARLLDHKSKHWDWVNTELNVSLTSTGIPHEVTEGEGEVVLKLFSSYNIDDTDTSYYVTKPLKKIEISTEELSVHSIKSNEDLTCIVTEFKSAIDAVASNLTNVTKVHLFASVPVGVAFMAGTKINPNVHAKIQSYQYSSNDNPKYTPVLMVQELVSPADVLTDVDKAVIGQLRLNFKNCLDNKVQSFVEVLNTKEEVWYRKILDTDANQFSEFERPYWGRMNSIDDTITMGSTIDVEQTEVEDNSFFYEKETKSWHLDDAFLFSISKRLIDENSQLRGLRLLVFHEGVHYRGHKLTSHTVNDIGRFPKILEEVDYQADVWAMVHEYKFSSIHERDITKDEVSFFKQLILTATEMMWAFEERSSSLSEMQVRRVNRYLIWYWQYVRLSDENCDNLSKVISILADKPVIELRGPSLKASGPRVLNSFERIDQNSLEIGVLWKNAIERRASGSSIDLIGLIEGFRKKDGSAIISTLTSLYDQLPR